jgi:formamidopyrimidine-DNA glycosylase
LKIAGIEVLKEKSFQGEKKQVIGKKVLGVKRRAKIILIELESEFYLAIHLKLTGQLIYIKSKIKNQKLKLQIKSQKLGPYEIAELPNKYTRVIIKFTNNSQLFFNDLRIFGWVKIVENLSELEKLGPEANDEKTFTLNYFQKILSQTKKPVKLVILDQEKLAGVGNIYANESLFMAGIDPHRPANSLTGEEIKMLRYSILSVLKKAIKHKGTSDRDEAYRQINGEKGDFQNYLQIYGRAGQSCPKCGRSINKIKIGGRGTYFCPNCQK